MPGTVLEIVLEALLKIAVETLPEIARRMAAGRNQCSTRGTASVNSGILASNWVPSSAVIW